MWLIGVLLIDLLQCDVKKANSKQDSRGGGRGGFRGGRGFGGQFSPNFIALFNFYMRCTSRVVALLRYQLQKLLIFNPNADILNVNSNIWVHFECCNLMELISLLCLVFPMMFPVINMLFRILVSDLLVVCVRLEDRGMIISILKPLYLYILLLTCSSSTAL